MNQLKKTALILSVLLMAALPCYADGLSGLIYIFYAGLALVGIYLLTIVLCFAYYRRVKQRHIPVALKIFTWLLLAINVWVAVIMRHWDTGPYFSNAIFWLLPLIQVCLIINRILSKTLSHRAHMLLYSFRTSLTAYLIGDLASVFAYITMGIIPHIIAFQLPLLIVLLYISYSIYKYLQAVKQRYPEHFTRKYCISYAMGLINIYMLVSIYLIPVIWRLIIELFSISGSIVMAGYNPIYFIWVFGISNMVAYVAGLMAYRKLVSGHAED